MNKLILIDGNSIICRYFYGIPEKKTPDGINVNGVFGFVNFLIKLLLDEISKIHLSIVVMFDKASKNFRKKLLPSYKQNRKKLPDNFFYQIKLCEEICNGFNIPIDYNEEYEADDLLASYCEKYKDDYEEIIVYSNDKDLLQLVTPKVKIYNLLKKIFFNEETVESIMHIKPNKIPEFLAIAGDASDNIPGIPRIGPKTAVKLLQKYGSIGEIINYNTTSTDFNPALGFLEITRLCYFCPIKNTSLMYYKLPEKSVCRCLEKYGFLDSLYMFKNKIH